MNNPMRKSIFCGLVALSLTAVTHAQEKPVEASTVQHDVAVGLAGVSATTSGVSLGMMYDIYRRSGNVLFEKTPDNLTPLNRAEIQRLASSIKQGDEVRISYMTSEAEEQAIRITQLENRKKELIRETDTLRNRLTSQAQKGLGRESAVLATKLTDLTGAVADIETEISDLVHKRVEIASRPAMRRVDTDKLSLAAVEKFILNKVTDGKDILKVEVIPSARRKQFRTWAKVGGSSAVVMIASGAVLMLEIVPSESGLEGDDTLAGSTLYVPELKNRPIQ